MPAWQPLLDWWFGAAVTASEVAAQRSGLWFGYRAEQDDDARRLFGELCEQALAGGLEDWCGCAEGRLALLLLLDQLPRMIHRGTAQAFAGDSRARQVLREGLAQGFDHDLPAIRRVFAYLVLEHAEDLALQDEAVARFGALRDQRLFRERVGGEEVVRYAERHREIIARFGRFPHRNAVLGRASTPEETDFLTRPGSSF